VALDDVHPLLEVRQVAVPLRELGLQQGVLLLPAPPFLERRVRLAEVPPGLLQVGSPPERMRRGERQGPKRAPGELLKALLVFTQVREAL